jgi:S-DNA-T family DNA segregation ATPase FtsK/SpoIIIE
MEQKFDFSQADPLFVEVAKYVVETGKAQASALQRDFELGYNRASRIISQLQAAGIVGEAVHCKPRAVLCTAEELEQKLAEWQK